MRFTKAAFPGVLITRMVILWWRCLCIVKGGRGLSRDFHDVGCTVQNYPCHRYWTGWMWVPLRPKMAFSSLVANIAVSRSHKRMWCVAGSAEGGGYQLFQNCAAQSQNEVGLDMKLDSRVTWWLQPLPTLLLPTAGELILPVGPCQHSPAASLVVLSQHRSRALNGLQSGKQHVNLGDRGEQATQASCKAEFAKCCLHQGRCNNKLQRFCLEKQTVKHRRWGRRVLCSFTRLLLFVNSG